MAFWRRRDRNRMLAASLAGGLVAWALVVACVGQDPDVTPQNDADVNAPETGTADSLPPNTEDGATTDAGGDGPIVFTPDPACLPPSAASSVLAQTHYGFRDAQGGCGWSYRFSDTPTPVGSKDMPFFDGTRWLVTDASITHIASKTAHPGSAISPIRRWVSPYSGDIRVRGTVTAAPDVGSGNGFALSIFLKSNLLERVDVDATMSSKAIDHALRIAVGDELDFLVDSNGESGFDTLNYTLEIVRD